MQKKWYQSRTVWGAILGAFLSLEPTAVKVANGTATAEDYARLPFVLVIGGVTVYGRSKADGPLI